MSTATAPILDIGRTLDDGPFTGMQKMVVLMAALAIVLDGFDGQFIGFAIPLMIKEWGASKEAFGVPVAAGLIGMAVGMAVAGVVADRIGRRLVLAASVFVFGATTVAIGFTPNLLTLTVLRFIAGMGIGGALPCSSTMTAEFTPARARTLAVSLTIVCYPLGGMLAGLFAGLILPAYGWRGLFWIGGLLPVLFSLILVFTMPESPRFLAHHRDLWPQLVRLLGRMQRHTLEGTQFADAAEEHSTAPKAGFGALFEGSLALDTLAIWTAFFMTVLALYTTFSWLPTMLANEGIPPALASQGLTAYNLGGVIGALLCAVCITRFGSRWPMALAATGAAASAFAMVSVNVAANPGLLIFGFGVHGLFVNSVQVPLYALCAHVYETEVRATGTAAGLAVGRGGGVISSFLGAAVITAAGAAGYLSLLGASMAAAAIALLVVRKHIPPVAKGAEPRPAAVGAH